MNARYAHSPLARALAALSLAASILGSVSTASAATCTFSFPTTDKLCAQGTSAALANHRFQVVGGAIKYRLEVDMQGGTAGAYAYGIDGNGNHLNRCPTTATDDDNRIQKQRPVSCERLMGTSGPSQSVAIYDHPVNMASTFVAVI